MSELPPDPAQIPRVRPGIDLTRAGLSPDEGYLVSRVDGRTSVRELAILVGKPIEETTRTVHRLGAAGVLILGTEPEPKGSSQDIDPYEGFWFDSDALAEPVDLSTEEKKRILYTHAHLDEWTFYQLLGVRWRDDAKTVKRAFREKSKEWHPDRFRRPQLGSFKARINDIFRAITEANAVLTDKERKARYDREHAPSFDEEDMAAVLREHRREDREERREAELVRRRKERNPIRRRMERARQLYEQALELEKKGELLEALRIAQAACAYHDREEYRALRRRLQKDTAEMRVAPLMKRGLHAETIRVNPDDAIDIFSEAVRLAPEHGPAHLRLAANMLNAGRDAKRALSHARKAIELMPEDPEAYFVAGLCYERADKRDLAIRMLKRALELKANYVEAKKRLRKLEWGF